VCVSAAMPLPPRTNQMFPCLHDSRTVVRLTMMASSPAQVK
jgi:hypothetical protein